MTSVLDFGYHVALLLVTVAAGWFGGYLTAYSRRLGENVATKQDLAELTRIAKTVETGLAGGLWVEQERWKSRLPSIRAFLRT